MFIPNIPRNAQLTCSVSSIYLFGLMMHVNESPVLSPKVRQKILMCLAPHTPAG